MAEKTKVQLEPLSLRETAFEHFEQFFESIAEQAQFTPEQQLALGEQLKTGVEKRDKLGNCLAWLEGQADLLRLKEKQLAERRRRFEKFGDAVRSSLHQQMLDWGIKRVEGQEFSFTVKKNPPRVEIVNEEAIPAEFISYTPAVNKSAIKSALEEGKEVPGAELVQSTRLDIR
jgi:Siphovirus Gp157